MGFYVHLSVIFSCDSNDGVAALAARHLARLGRWTEEELGKPELPGLTEARWFLQDLSTRTGENRGPKGGLSLWGMVGNHTKPDAFVELLRPFWLELYTVKDGPHGHEHILVFYEFEQSEHANAIEIWRPEAPDDLTPTGELVVRKHECLPFAWVQY